MVWCIACWPKMTFTHAHLGPQANIDFVLVRSWTDTHLSAISYHHLDTGHPVTPNDFFILTSSSTSFKLFLRESPLINELKPSLNATIASYPLALFWITNYDYFNFKLLVILNGNLLLRHLQFYSLPDLHVTVLMSWNGYTKNVSKFLFKMLRR